MEKGYATWQSVNLARAVRISGDGGQEGRHLAKKTKKVSGCLPRAHLDPRAEAVPDRDALHAVRAGLQPDRPEEGHQHLAP